MSFDDLNLEFEDEEEAKKKKNDAVHVDVDLEFQLTDEGKPKTDAKAAAPGAAPQGGAPKPQAKAPGEVKKLDDARKAPVAQKTVQTGAPRVVGSSAIKEEIGFEIEAQEMVDLRNQMRKVEFDAEVKVAIAEYKTELIGELLGDMKIMEHQIGQLLTRINAKHPDMKQEALMIKKILADFTAKKRK